jgi:hypothetical protein
VNLVELDVSYRREMTGGLDHGFSLAEVEQEPFDRQDRHDTLDIGRQGLGADQGERHRCRQPLIAADDACRQPWEQRGARYPGRQGRLAGLLPGHTGGRVTPLSQVDEFPERVGVRRVEGGRGIAPTAPDWRGGINDLAGSGGGCLLPWVYG